jgi:hypothetical protein
MFGIRDALSKADYHRGGSRCAGCHHAIRRWWPYQSTPGDRSRA